MDSSRFESLADATLTRLQAAIEEQSDGDIDAELAAGILTLELESGAKYLINKHGPNRQIWLASPVSGAWHFAWSEGDQAWVSTRGGERLDRLLGGELSQASGHSLDLG
jgi:frataxin